ncbi:MAG: hypothetical protein H7123_09795, partial [Thermoleophilia bacterium]|nr:hypothetical protein [Thermoleophilia bacterium]
ITDAAGNIMWSKTNSGGSASGASGGTCSQPSDQVVDITTKEQQVSDCIESQIKTQIAQLVGSSDHVVATATVTLNPSATSTSVNALSKGALVTKSETKSNGNGAGNDSTDLTNQPGTKHIQTDTMAGNIKGLAIAVTLDSRYVSPALEAAVRDQLAPYYNKARGDAAPNVRSAPFATPADTTTTTTTGGATGSPATTAAPLPKNDVPITQSTHIPTSLTVMVGVLLLGLVSMIALLWRRSGKDRGERERLEREFSTEHNMFMNFAQEDPDALAREMEAMMGAPTPRS